MGALEGLAKLDLGIERIQVWGEKPWERESEGKEGYDHESKDAREIKVGAGGLGLEEEAP